MLHVRVKYIINIELLYRIIIIITNCDKLEFINNVT